MINENKLLTFRQRLPQDPGPLPWEVILKAGSLETLEKIERATKMACGQFNYWEGDHRDVVWPNVASEDWTAVILGEKDINEMNLASLRRRMLAATEDFLKRNLVSSDSICSEGWWVKLTRVFGGDPLRKRETLLWMILQGLGFDVPEVEKGCIDYNVIVALRKHGVVEGFKGNAFDLYGETQLRYDCLEAIQRILEETDYSISSLDALLYKEGRRIRHEESDWEEYFCYRPGCYFY